MATFSATDYFTTPVFKDTHKEEKKMLLKDRILVPYSAYSRGGRALAKALGFQFVRGIPEVAPLVNKTSSTTVINWGCAKEFEKHPSASVTQFNKAEKVNLCGNKIKFFYAVKGKVRIPEVTEDLAEALTWVESGAQVMGRSLRGTCGKDIVFYEDDLKAFSSSDFWAKYKKKKMEFRVHIAFGKIIAVQQKVLRTADLEGNKIDTSNVDYRIRNLTHGFIFKRHDIAPPNDVMNQAAAAMETVGLDFGAVDVIYNANEDKAYVLEINTAPGLEGTTILDYAGAFKEKLGLA